MLTTTLYLHYFLPGLSYMLLGIGSCNIQLINFVIHITMVILSFRDHYNLRNNNIICVKLILNKCKRFSSSAFALALVLMLDNGVSEHPRRAPVFFLILIALFEGIVQLVHSVRYLSQFY
jgi:hypothetical protein